MKAKTIGIREFKLATLAVITVVLVAGCFWVVSHGEQVLAWAMDTAGLEQGAPEEHYIPEGYTGWVSVRYDVPASPLLPRREGAIIFSYDATGTLVTSSPRNEGVKRQEFFCTENGQQVQLQVAGRGEEFLIGEPPPEEKRIWHLYSASQHVTDGEPGGWQMTGFFVGTKQQYDTAGLPLPW